MKHSTQQAADLPSKSSPSARWRADELGQRQYLNLQQGQLAYHDAGDGAPVVFVHGALVNANLWRAVVGRLAGRFRCVTLDLPLGGHLEPFASNADLSPPALAGLIADAIDDLGLENVTLVGNDTGGALCQILIASRPQRIAGLVLTSCDALDNFPPKMLRPMIPVMTLSWVAAAMFVPFRVAAVRRRALAIAGLAKHSVAPAATDSYLLPAATVPAVRRDARRALRSMHRRYTLEAAERFDQFGRPTLLAWSREDKFFSPKYAERLAELLPGARLEWIDDAYTLSPEDQPQRLGELISAFVSDI